MFFNNSNRFKQKVVSFFTNKKFKRLNIGKISVSGKNFTGKITSRSRGLCNSKHNHILIDFFRNWSNKIALCINITKSTNLTCFLCLIKYSNGTFSYILSSHGLKPGTIILSTIKPELVNFKYMLGWSVILRYLNDNFIFFNVEIKKKEGGKYSRAAGTFCKLLSIYKKKSLVKIQFPTGLIKLLSIYCFVTLGRSSNIYHNKEFFTKAGFNRNKGFRPSVRGVSMNPVDHPNGGRTKTKQPLLTPWGKIAKFNK